MVLIPTRRKIVVLKLLQTKIVSNLEKTYKEHNLRSDLYKVLHRPESEKTNQAQKWFFLCCRVLLSHHLECGVFGPVSVAQCWLQPQAVSSPEVSCFYFHSKDVRPVCHYTGCFVVLLSQQIGRNSCNDALQYTTGVISSPDGLLWYLLILLILPSHVMMRIISCQ